MLENDHKVLRYAATMVIRLSKNSKLTSTPSPPSMFSELFVTMTYKLKQQTIYLFYWL